MSEPSKQEQSQEPSMEEILASIRRIISDDGSEAEAGQAAAAETPKAAKSAAKQSDEATEQPEQSPVGGPIDLRSSESEMAEPEAEEEPLELTEAIQDDGTVVDLAQQRAATRPTPAQPEVVPKPSPEEPTEPPAAEEDVSLELYGDDDSERPEEPAEEAMSERERDRLVSEATETATLAALSELAHAEEREPQPLSLPGGERTLEQVVRDAISEHLRTWLDANLPDLVERVVREEVRRLARRAEDS